MAAIADRVYHRMKGYNRPIMGKTKTLFWFWISVLTGLAFGCQAAMEDALIPVSYPTDAWALWQNGPWLRGANVYQRRVFPELDGTLFYGPGPFGPPYTQDDLRALAAEGANWVVLSVPGPYTVTRPYRPDPAAFDHLLSLVDMAAQADLFVVVAVRAGPGRSEFSILREGAGDWFDPSYLHEEVWSEPEARRAWAAMWRWLARRLCEHPAVVGYELMVEPNADDIVGLAGDPEAFYARYEGTGYDWNTWYPDLVRAIREVDTQTPILVSPLGYADPLWLPYLRPVADERLVYSVHLYGPHAYTHQEPEPTLAYHYPGLIPNDQETPEWVDAARLEEEARALAAFREQMQVPIAVTETGVIRWEPGADVFMRDRLEALERYGLNYAVWMWYPDWPALRQGDHDFNFRLGPDPRPGAEQANALWNTYRHVWARNTVRLSLWGTPQPAQP